MLSFKAKNDKCEISGSFSFTPLLILLGAIIILPIFGAVGEWFAGKYIPTEPELKNQICIGCHYDTLK